MYKLETILIKPGQFRCSERKKRVFIPTAVLARIATWVCVFTLVFAAPVAQAGDCQEGAAVGQLEGARKPTPGALAAGGVGGLVFSWLGMLIAVGASSIDQPIPLAHLYPTGNSKQYDRCFLEAYQMSVKRKRRRQAFLGGLPGSVLWTVVGLSAL
jgi:hypothetical protein